jgi:hypothetical protein
LFDFFVLLSGPPRTLPLSFFLLPFLPFLPFLLLLLLLGTQIGGSVSGTLLGVGAFVDRPTGDGDFVERDGAGAADNFLDDGVGVSVDAGAMLDSDGTLVGT